MTNNTDQVYNVIARHFDIFVLPKILMGHLPQGPLALADFGCGDGPFFFILQKMEYISNAKPVYAIDLSKVRLEGMSDRFPYIIQVVSSVEHVPLISDSTLDFVISTMVMEHVKEENKYLNELSRVLVPGGKAYITTVFKKTWARYFRSRQEESVLDVTHLREYIDLDRFKTLVMDDSRFSTILAVDVTQLWFPLIDPLLFRILRHPINLLTSRLIQILRLIRIPIPGYFTLSIIVQK